MLPAMPTAIRFHEHGGPDVLRVEQVTPGKPGAKEVQVRHTAIGVNYIDVYDRTGLYPVTLPSGLGREAAGVITALGRGVRAARLTVRSCDADRVDRRPSLRRSNRLPRGHVQ